MTIRVLRLIEYTYATSETMIDDMERWQVQRAKKLSDMTIRSATLPPEILTEDDPRIPNDFTTLPNDSAVGRMGSSGYIKFLPEDRN